MIVSLSSFLSSHVTLPMWLKNLAKSHRYLLRRTMWLKNLVKSVRYLLRRSWLVFWCFQVPYTCIPRGYLWVTVIFVRSSITHIFFVSVMSAWWDHLFHLMSVLFLIRLVRSTPVCFGLVIWISRLLIIVLSRFESLCRDSISELFNPFSCFLFQFSLFFPVFPYIFAL